MALAIGKAGRNLSPEAALNHVVGYGVAIDFTRRDLQQVAKDLRRPWDAAKGFDQSCPCSRLIEAEGRTVPTFGTLSLRVNDTMKQQGDIADMIWPPAMLIASVSSYMAVRSGDLFLTGTPSGVGEVGPGDVISVYFADEIEDQVVIL